MSSKLGRALLVKHSASCVNYTTLISNKVNLYLILLKVVVKSEGNATYFGHFCLDDTVGEERRMGMDLKLGSSTRLWFQKTV